MTSHYPRSFKRCSLSLERPHFKWLDGWSSFVHIEEWMIFIHFGGETLQMLHPHH